MEELKPLLINFQEHCEQLGAIKARKQTVSGGLVEVDCKVWAEHKVKGEVPDNLGAWEDREGSERVEKVHEEHSDQHPAPNIRASKGSARMINNKQIESFLLAIRTIDRLLLCLL